MVLNNFSGAVYDLFKVQQNVTVVAQCLQLLINVTFDSPNTSIYLTSRQGFLTTLVSLIDVSALSNDATWLLTHLFADGMVDLSKLH
jgi:hypothetical protein